MDIVLVRHATAVPRVQEPIDVKRELTKRGRKQFSKICRSVKKHVNPGRNVIIWTSTAARALQTAEILACELDIENIVKHYFIYSGNYSSFCDALQGIDENATLFVVGHEPSLGEWSVLLSGTRVAFKKGAMVNYHLLGMNPPKAELKWKIRASLPDEEEPNVDVGQYFTMNDYKEVVLKLLAGIEDLRVQFLKSPNDIESVHYIRVKIRQIRSLLSFIKPMTNKREYVAIQEKLRAMAEKFSYIREIDVLTIQWQSLKDSSVELTSSNAVSGILHSEREAEKRMLCDYVAGDSMSDELGRTAKRVERWNGDYEDEAAFEQFAIGRYKQWNNDVANAMKQMDPNDLANIHRIRIRFKKLRYVQSNIKLFSNSAALNLESLKSIQDTLGDICDTFVGIALLEKLRKKYPSDDLLHETDAFIEHLRTHRKKLLNEAEDYLKTRE